MKLQWIGTISELRRRQQPLLLFYYRIRSFVVFVVGVVIVPVVVVQSMLHVSCHYVNVKALNKIRSSIQSNKYHREFFGEDIQLKHDYHYRHRQASRRCCSTVPTTTGSIISIASSWTSSTTALQLVAINQYYNKDNNSNKKKKKKLKKRTIDNMNQQQRRHEQALNNHNTETGDDKSKDTGTNAVRINKVSVQQQQQKLQAELQRCNTIDDVLFRVGSIVPCTIELDNNNFNTIILSSHVLIRLSKLYIQRDNQSKLPIESSTSMSPKVTNAFDSSSIMNNTNISIMHNVINTLIISAVAAADSSASISTNTTITNNNTMLLIMMIDAIVDGTKASAILSRLINSNDVKHHNQYKNMGLLIYPWIEFWARHGPTFVPLMDDHHITGVQWAMDCFNCYSAQQQRTGNNKLLSFTYPPSITQVYKQLQVPFHVIPCCLSSPPTQRFNNDDNTSDYAVTVEQIVAEVDFRNDEIYATGTGESVTERRFTAWQGDRHVAPFAYSGKSMTRDDWSPTILHIRNQVYNRTGQYYDSCLLNLYPNGKSGMRYHSDPDQGTLWDNDTAVVSIGASRRFTFRSINHAENCTSSSNTIKKGLSAFRLSRQQQQQQSQPHSFTVMDSDVTYMFGDCQQRYQHSVKNAENKNEMTPRISLVYKRTYQYVHDDL